MAELYTTLVHVKQALNGGRVPPMTPIPLPVRHLIDPSFTPGLGALEEDAEDGLRCPVRGCGQYFHGLAYHLRWNHPEIGGAKGLRRILEIPATAPLLSQKTLEAQREANRASRGAALSVMRSGGGQLGGAPARRKRARARRATHSSMGWRNLIGMCDAQVTHLLLDFAHRIGRTPSRREFQVEYGHRAAAVLVELYGSWNAALLRAGMQPVAKNGSRYDQVSVLEALRAYYNVHGRLPTHSEARLPTRAPLTPCASTVIKALGVKSWPDAMRVAAPIIGVRDGRWGLHKSSRRAS